MVDSSAHRRPADLPTPFFIAHRGMANVFPENSGEAYRGSVALGVDVLETDCWLTRDHGLVCLHDLCVDRTTTGTGATHDLTLPGAAVLRIDAGAWFAAAWPNTLPVPSFTDVLDELGGRVVLCSEAKNSGSGRAIVDRLAHRGLVGTAIVQSFIQAELRAATALGIPAMLLTATSMYDAVALQAAGIRYLGLSATLPTSLVAPARTNGLDVVAWVLDRRYDAAPWLAAGVVGLFSDDPVYLSGRSPVLTSDPFGQHTYYHGHLANAASGDRGTFWPPGAWGYDDTAPAYKGALQGWGCPVSGDHFALRFTVCFDAVSDRSGFASAFVAAADDRSFDDAEQHQPGSSGYHVLLRRSGALEIHVVTDGLIRRRESVATPAIEAGGTATVRIDVTRDQVEVSRVDLARPASVTVGDATHRGRYFHLGRRGAAVRFSQVTVERIE